MKGVLLNVIGIKMGKKQRIRFVKQAFGGVIKCVEGAWQIVMTGNIAVEALMHG